MRKTEKLALIAGSDNIHDDDAKTRQFELFAVNCKSCIKLKDMNIPKCNGFSKYNTIHHLEKIIM